MFHVRIYGAPVDRGPCHDGPPYWPWYSRHTRREAVFTRFGAPLSVAAP